MKNLLCIFSMLFLMVACDKDDSNGRSRVKKATIAGAQFIYENPGAMTRASDGGGTFMMVDKDGNSKEILFTDENGKEINDINVQKTITNIVDLNDDYLIMDGFFRFGSDENYTYYNKLLVNKKTEIVYGTPADIGLNIESIYEDSDKNFYFESNVSVLGNTIYKMDISNLDNITISQYLPSGLLFDKFIVNKKGVAYYRDNTRYNFKCPGGRVYSINELISAIDFNNDDVKCFKGLNALFYIHISSRSEFVDGNFKTIQTIYRINELNNNELKAEKVAELNTRDQQFGYSFFCPNSIKNTHILSNGEKILEFNETTNELKVLDIQIPQMYLPDLYGNGENTYITSNSVFVYGENNKLYQLKLSDYSLSTIDLVSKGFDIGKEYVKSSSAYPGLSFSGFRYSDGRNVIGTIDENGNVSANENITLNAKTTTLVRLN